METQAPKFHTRDQQEAMLRAVKEPRHRVMILLMLDLGMRVTEARKLHWEHCDFRDKTLKVGSLKKRKDSKKPVRIIPISERLYAAFEELLREGVTPKGPIFPGSDNGYLGRSAVNMMLRRLEGKNPAIGQTRPHKLRHTAATMLLANNGQDMNQVSKFLGHESVRTTGIYTHSEVEAMRAAMNANTPRPSFLQRIKAKLFPPRRTLISLLSADTEFIVGRDKEQKQIQSLISRGISVIITGSIGSGKTHLLQSMNFDTPTLLIDDCSDFKKSVAAAILHICGDKETAAAMLFKTSDLKAVETKLSTSSLANLVQTLKDVTQPREYLLKIGNIDGITPRIVKVLEELKDHFCIITTARAVPLTASFAWPFEKVELAPLTRPDSLKMIYRLIGDLPVGDLDGVMTRLYDTADGNPRKLRELCDRLRREPFINLDTATEVANGYLGRQVEEFDFSVILLVILGGFVLLRYYGRETGEKDLQFIGACIMLVMMFARYFFRSARRKSL